MHQDQTTQSNQPGKDETAFIGELQRFTDPPGGAPLDDPEVRARKRRGRPSDHRNTAQANENGTLPVE